MVALELGTEALCLSASSKMLLRLLVVVLMAHFATLAGRREKTMKDCKSKSNRSQRPYYVVGHFLRP